MRQTYEAQNLAEIAAEFRRRAATEIDNQHGAARASAWRDAADILTATTLKPKSLFSAIGEMQP